MSEEQAYSKKPMILEGNHRFDPMSVQRIEQRPDEGGKYVLTFDVGECIILDAEKGKAFVDFFITDIDLAALVARSSPPRVSATHSMILKRPDTAAD